MSATADHLPACSGPASGSPGTPRTHRTQLPRPCASAIFQFIKARRGGIPRGAPGLLLCSASAYVHPARAVARPARFTSGKRRGRVGLEDFRRDAISPFHRTSMKPVNRRIAARMKRLDDYPGEGLPPPGTACELLCEDHVGTYALPYLCQWSDGTWRNIKTGEPVIGGVVAWRKTRHRP